MVQLVPFAKTSDVSSMLRRSPTSKGELYTIITNKDAHGGKGTLVAMDLSESMRKIVEICFPRATRVIDRFHVQKLALEAVQEIRIKRRWSGEGRLRLFPNACRDHL